MRFNSADEYFLKEAHKLAKKGFGWVNPNPMVGAIIVKDGKIIASGYHKKFGGPHAEIEAITSAKTNLGDATIYLNLEPCCYFGKTPPCTEAIIQAGIKRVVCSVLDPNPKVDGKGAEILKKAGVDITTGVLKDEAEKLNEAFFTFHQKERPFIALKFAASLDGKIATKTGDSKWITNDKARLFARNLRSQYQAVLVGANTVIKDNPHLGARIKGRRDPLRISLDPDLTIPLTSKIFRDENVLIATSLSASKKKMELLKQKGIKLLVFQNKKILLKDLLNRLKDQQIISILVEGGSFTLGKFYDEKLFDKVYAFYSPMIIGGEKYIKDAIYLKDSAVKKINNNVLITGYLT